mgnify:CR=1 FL=1
MNDEDKMKREHGADATQGKPLRPTRRQFLKGLTTGTVAIGAGAIADGERRPAVVRLG